MLVHDRGRLQEALLMLEPVELDVVAMHNILNTPSEMVSHGLYSMQSVHRLADKILLATKWMSEGRHRHGKTILDRFHIVLGLRKHWDEGLFELARFLDILICSRSQEKNTNDENSSLELFQLYNQVIEYYGKSIRFKHKYASQALPRLLTLWTTYCAKQDIPSGSATASETSKVNKKQDKEGSSTTLTMKEAKNILNTTMRSIAVQVPVATWYTSTSLLVSRAGHANKETLLIIKKLLATIVSFYPRQAIWHL